MSTVVISARVLWRATFFSFFSEISSVTEMDHGVCVHAWAQGLRWRAREVATAWGRGARMTGMLEYGCMGW